MVNVRIYIGLMGLLLLPMVSAMAAGFSPLKVNCVSVRNSTLFKVSNERYDIIPPVCKADDSSAEVSLPGGDIIVGVSADSYHQLTMDPVDHSGKFFLYLNGIALDKDASLVSVLSSEGPGQQKAGGNNVYFRFSIKQGDETRQIWEMLYRDAGLTHPGALNVALLWSSDGVAPKSWSAELSRESLVNIQLTTGWQVFFALLLLALVAVMVIYLDKHTGIFRDAGDELIPEWWDQARVLRGKYISAKKNGGNFLIIITALYAEYDPNSPTQKSDYERCASDALSGKVIGPDDQILAQVGLILRAANWKPVRPSYSLSRVQLGLWFTFTVATSLFFWLIYGALQTIPGSMLILLGISVAGSSYSWMVDATMQEQRYSPSRGLLYDITTGFDERSQLHRFQAVVVNLLLLVVGINLVVQQLSWPDFDPSWLFMLGLSSATQGLGKQLIENKATTATP